MEKLQRTMEQIEQMGMIIKERTMQFEQSQSDIRSDPIKMIFRNA